MDESGMQQAASYYPLMLDLRGRKCLVVGGGEVARRKVDGLLAAGAIVTVVAPSCREMPADVEVITRSFRQDDLAGAWLVIAATDDLRINAQVADAATAQQIWVNVVDDPQRCTAIMPAVVRRGLLCLAISTGGACPTWAQRLCNDLAAQYGPEYGIMAELLREARQLWKARSAHLSQAERKHAWTHVLNLPILDFIRNGQVADAKSAILSCLEKTLVT